MKATALPLNRPGLITDEPEGLAAAWEDLSRQLRQTRSAIRRYRCELDAIRRCIHLRSRIRSIERRIVARRIAAIAQTSHDPELRQAAIDVLQAIEPGVTASSGCRPRWSASDREAGP